MTDPTEPPKPMDELPKSIAESNDDMNRRRQTVPADSRDSKRLIQVIR
ncbi:hypothetical protein [Natrinema gelatinilyticum]|nr:hypothetical protein [Natrinema gelatinilyticum]